MKRGDELWIPMTTFRERFKKRRKFMGITLKQIGAYLGVTEGNVQRYECGTVKIPADKLDKIAEILECDLAYLWGYIDTPRAPVATPEQEGIDEARLIKKYRRLNEKQKSAVHVVIDSFLDTAQQGKQEDS